MGVSFNFKFARAADIAAAEESTATTRLAPPSAALILNPPE